MTDLNHVARLEAAKQAATASLLRDKAEELEREGNFAMASTYYRYAAKADERRSLFLRMLS